MLDQTEFLPLSNRYQPQAWLVDMFLSLLDLPVGARILVIEHTTDISRAAQSRGLEVARIDNWMSVSQQLQGIVSIGQVQGAILMPVFSSAMVEPGTPPHGWSYLGRTASEDWLLAYAASQLTSSGSLVALVPNGLLTNYRRLPTRHGLIQSGLSAVISLPARHLFVDTQSIISSSIVLLRRDNIDGHRTITFIDLSESENVAAEAARVSLDSVMAGGNAIKIVASSIDENLRLDPRYYDPKYLQIKPPDGYIEMSLGEICEIKGGVSIRKEDRYDTCSSDACIPYLQVRHIQDNHRIAEGVYWVDLNEVPQAKMKIAKPGDILVTSAGTIGKVAVVPPNFVNGVLFDTSLRSLRVNLNNLDASTVAEFLQSEIGQLQLRRLTSGSAIPVLTTPALASISVFLPVSESGDIPDHKIEVDVQNNSTQARSLADAIEGQVLTYLRNIDTDDTDWPYRTAILLSQLTNDLIPKKLEDIVSQDFPTPIAIPYRRYLMAKHNPYERLDRMVSLVESCVYFVFNILLADHCHQSFAGRVTLSPEAKNAKKGSDSYGYKLKFIDDHLVAARSGTIGLYMPELVSSRVYEIGDSFRSKVRNVLAHSAPGSEAYVRALISENETCVHELLDSLLFLGDYTLCRIRGHYYRDGHWYYQAEVYRGAEYDVNIREDAVSTFSGEDREDLHLLQAEMEHLILLGANGEILDLYPFYQMYFGSETCQESQMYFFKRYKNDQFIGESIRNSREVNLPGIDDFKILTSE